jgi:hypothetical protein
MSTRADRPGADSPVLLDRHRAPRSLDHGPQRSGSGLVDEWLRRTLRVAHYVPETLAETVALRLRVHGDSRYARSQWLRRAAAKDADKGLDILDAVLSWSERKYAVDAALSLGGSVWKVNDTADGLARR